MCSHVEVFSQETRARPPCANTPPAPRDVFVGRRTCITVLVLGARAKAALRGFYFLAVSSARFRRGPIRRWRRSPIIRDIAHRPFLRAPRTLARALGVRHRHALAHGHMAPHYDTPKGLARATVAYDGDTQYSAASPRLSALPSLPPPFVPFATPSATSSAASPAAAAAHALGHRLLARAPNSAASATPPMLML